MVITAAGIYIFQTNCNLITLLPIIRLRLFRILFLSLHELLFPFITVFTNKHYCLLHQ